jgi:cob(I)alamin adenosyltransferase
MKIYTRGGDRGKTSLLSGGRIDKDDPRLEAYGTLDELNSVLGMVRAELAEAAYSSSSPARRLDEVLGYLQQELFDLGSELATPPEAEYDGMIRIQDEQITRLEALIDELQDDLEPLKSFVLPGGGKAAATLHLARTVCRRAERLVVGLAAEQNGVQGPARYLNRLSDLLFVQSRWIAAQTGQAETLWQHGLTPPKAADKPDKAKP